MLHVSRRITTELLQKYFPGIADLYRRADEFWADKTKGHVQMEFGLFYSMAINVDMGERVISIPHRNSLNLAFGVCSIWAFGEQTGS